MSSPATQLQAAEQTDKIRLRVWPVLACIGLVIPSFFLSGLASHAAERFLGMERAMAMRWVPLYVGHAGMLIGALLTIAVLSRGRLGDYGLKVPAGRTYVTAALSWGAAFGVIMFVVDYSHQLAAHTAPPLALTRANIAG